MGKYTEEIVLDNFKLLDQHTDHFMVFKDSDIYYEYADIFEQYEKDFENSKGIIFNTKKVR